MKVYKGTDKNMQCRGFRYEIGKEYKTEEADICNVGFHGCEYPLDVFRYYAPSESRYFEADLEANDQLGDDSKRVGKKIKLKAEIGIPGIVSAAVEYIKEKVDLENSMETNTGYRSAATNTGNQSAATNTGNQSAATNTGDRSAATNTGDRSVATVEGKESVAMAIGYKSKAKGAIGCFIVLAEWEKYNGQYHMIDVKAAKVDGEKIKADTFYEIKNGEFVEAE